MSRSLYREAIAFHLPHPRTSASSGEPRVGHAFYRPKLHSRIWSLSLASRKRTTLHTLEIDESTPLGDFANRLLASAPTAHQGGDTGQPASE